jgi:hypothetical protein
MAEVIAGASVRLRVGPSYVGWAADVSGREAVQYEEIHVLNLLETREHAEVGYVASMNARVFRILGRSLKAAGIYPKLGNVLTNGTLSASIESTVRGQSPYQFIGLKAAEKDFDVNARGIIQENVSFVCTRVHDAEAELAAA